MHSMQLNSLKSILPHPNPLSLQFNENKIYIFFLYHVKFKSGSKKNLNPLKSIIYALTNAFTESQLNC